MDATSGITSDASIEVNSCYYLNSAIDEWYRTSQDGNDYKQDITPALKQFKARHIFFAHGDYLKFI